MEATSTDRIRPAPTALFRMAPYPELPQVREVTGDVELITLVTELLGGDPEQRLEPDASSTDLGVIDVYVRGVVKVHVHSHPGAFPGLQRVVAEFELDTELQAFAELTGVRVLTIQGPPPGICICGRCGPGDDSGLS